jgi:hypothetical protein
MSGLGHLLNRYSLRCLGEAGLVTLVEDDDAVLEQLNVADQIEGIWSAIIKGEVKLRCERNASNTKAADQSEEVL